MANVGEQLTQPESGMKRIDDAFYAIKYTGSSWTYFSNGDTNYNNGTGHSNNKKGEYYEIYCYTSKFNIIANYSDNLSNDIDVFVNSEKENISQYNSATKTKICIFKKEFEKKQIIHIKVINNTNNYINFDCIDIDEDGYMLYCDDNNKLYYDMTPIMTSNNTPSPYVASASSYHSSDYEAYKAFNGSNGLWATSNGTVTGWIKLDFGENTRVDSFLLKGRIDIATPNIKDFKLYGSDDDVTYTEINSYSNITFELGENKLFKLEDLQDYRYYKIEISANNGYASYSSIDELRYLLAIDTPFYLIQDNVDNKIYNYDEETNSLIEVQDTSILNADVFNNTCIYDLNKVKDLIDLKADGVKILSNQNIKSNIKTLKTLKQLFFANGDFSTRVANHIDSFAFNYTIPENTVIKTVVSISAGNGWYSYVDGAWTQLDNIVPLKDYSELSSEEKIQWNTFLDEVLTKGINIQEVNTLDFNTLNSEKIRFAYAIQISNTNTEAILKDLKWQFDSIGSYEQMSPKTDVNIKMTNNEISIQPLKNVELMKINVGISSQVPQVFDTSGLMDKETFKGKEINSVKLADKARNLEPNLSQIDGTRKYYGVDNNDGEMKLRTFPAGTHTEHIDTYVFDNLTKGVPQTVPFVEERPEVNVMPVVFKYREGLKNQEYILEKYSNDNITIKKNNIECSEEGLCIKDKWYMTSKQENDLYKTNQIDEFSNLKSLSYDTGYKYLVNSSPIGFRCNLSSNNYAIQYNIFVTGNEPSGKPILSNYEGGGIQLILFYDNVKEVMVKNKFNNVCHAIINNNLYIIVNGKDIINIGPCSISGGNTNLFYFGADPNGKSATSSPEQYGNYLQNFYIYKFAYFTRITSLDEFKGVIDANMNYNEDTKFINLYYDFHSSSNFASPTVGSLNIQRYTESQILPKDGKFIIEMDGKYYSAKKDNYDADTKKYREITFSTHDEFYNYAVDLSILNTNITINDETFKPIDKFTNYKLISDEDFKILLNAIKSNKEMIISRQNLSLLSAEKINAFKQIISKENNGNCKTVFSLDNGVTWKSYDVSTSQFIDLTNTLPLDLVATTKPDDLSEENKTKWNNLQNEIVEKGMDADNIQTLDFATLLGNTYKNIRFAYVLIRPTYDDKVTLQNMSWNIDEEGDYVQTNDVEVAVNSNRLTATSTKENLQNIKVNLLI